MVVGHLLGDRDEVVVLKNYSIIQSRFDPLNNIFNQLSHRREFWGFLRMYEVGIANFYRLQGADMFSRQFEDLSRDWLKWRCMNSLTGVY
jgi:hypothetical protein